VPLLDGSFFVVVVGSVAKAASGCEEHVNGLLVLLLNMLLMSR
jgi:hypothetical protein